MILPQTNRFFFTVDVDWIPGSDRGLEQLYEFCDTNSLKGTFFFAGRFAKEYPALVAEAVRLGHDIGTHGWEHGQKSKADEENFRHASLELRRDWLVRSTDAVAEAGAAAPRTFRAPNLLVSESTLDLLEELGYTHDSSVPARRLSVTYGHFNAPAYYFAPLSPYRPDRRRLDRIGDHHIIEVPPSAFFIPLNMSALRVFGPRAVRWTLDRLMTRSTAIVFFCHPSEFVAASDQVLPADNPRRHLEGIGPQNFAMLAQFLRDVEARGCTSARVTEIAV
jgi:peptidoglycan/xylan/chitin deacetylase (PgdA/CDA1 family)